jgi:mono/diheme cytochrome c family protein
VRSLFAGLLALGILAQAAPSHAQQPNPFPPGEGRDVVVAACVQCHGPNPFIQLRQGPDGWRRQVYDMILRGAQVQPSEVNLVVNYLVVNFGPGNNVPPPMVEISLPDGAGKVLVEERCALCHGLDRAAGTRRTRAEWDAIMSRMIFLGAPVSGDELKTIKSYLNDRVGEK